MLIVVVEGVNIILILYWEVVSFMMWKNENWEILYEGKKLYVFLMDDIVFDSMNKNMFILIFFWRGGFIIGEIYVVVFFIL